MDKPINHIQNLIKNFCWSPDAIFQIFIVIQ